MFGALISVPANLLVDLVHPLLDPATEGCRSAAQGLATTLDAS
ncbi:hypothetical protein [Streptomyces sp. NBC_01314]|nr:hypothetical protein OG622_48195 [Streptomyces sp. NBC_01314]